MTEATTPEPQQDVGQNDLSFQPGDPVEGESSVTAPVPEMPVTAVDTAESAPTTDNTEAVEATWLADDFDVSKVESAPDEIGRTADEQARDEGNTSGSRDNAALVKKTDSGIEFAAVSVEAEVSLNNQVEFAPETAVNAEAVLPESEVVPEQPRTSENVGAIDILVQMATKGEIDPKAIDIIDVTDRFLKAIAAAPKENLRQSGKILFHASVLLRMKAEALLTYIEENPLGDDFLEFDENGSPIIYDSRNQAVGRQITLQDLERALVRRSHMKQARQRRVTLEQLIEALRDAERLEAVRSKKRIEPIIDLEDYHEVNDVEDILELAHDEDIETVIERVDAILMECLTAGELMSLIKLVQVLRGKSGKGDWVDAFLAVLFLSNAGKITLEQEEFYGPLYLTRKDESIPA